MRKSANHGSDRGRYSAKKSVQAAERITRQPLSATASPFFGSLNSE